MNRDFNVPEEQFAEWLARASEFAIHWLAREGRDPVLHAVTGRELLDRLDASLPTAGSPFESVFREFEEIIAQHARANGHPRYFAYVSASADPAGIVAELLAAAMNQNVTAWRSSPGAASVEKVVLRWLDELTGFNGSSGVLTGGGSAANFNALVMAITRAEHNGARRDAMTLYVSEDTHLSIAKAARVLGIAPAHVRALPLDPDRRMRTDALLEAIRADRQRDRHPLLVAASAGTANCGAIDPLVEIATIAQSEGLWLHIDGAYGAPAAMNADHAWLKEGFARADSLSIDPHKWLYAPLDIGCLLFRDAKLARETFSESAAYTIVTQSDPIEAHAWFDHGMELSRRFRALKLWFAMKLRGSDAYARAITENIELRRYLDESLQDEENIELLASGLSISCFRVHRDGLDEATLDILNRKVLQDLLDGGRFLLSPTELDGKFCLRICIVNFRTQRDDIDALLAAMRESGRQRLAELQ